MIKYETDSRNVMPGQTFVAIKGHTVDGHDYIKTAIKNGAIKIIAEKNIESSVPVEVVLNSEEYLKEQLVKEYKEKIDKLKIIGVTGTNGKTTTCFLTYQILKELGVNVAYIGTIGFYYQKEIVELSNTTPEILTLYKILLDLLKKGCTTIVMEVSSHALSLERIAGFHFDIGAFTNLTEDHLDYYQTMENYFNAKLKIIDYMTKDGTFLVNHDDIASESFLKDYQNTLTLGMKKDDYEIISHKITPAHTEIIFKFQEKNYNVTTNLTSMFNVYNYMTALAICHVYGYSIDEIIKITDKIHHPKGRCETYAVKDGFAVVDYAHTPDAVEKVITAYQELSKKRVITIVGCGGDRDCKKRPIMGSIASEKSDFVIFTTDNPRTENPENIMKDILNGVKKDNYKVIVDRKKAIAFALSMMEPEDIILVLGKGHENYQIIGHEKTHLDDVEEILNFKKNYEKYRN